MTSQISAERRGFAVWLRTGRWPAVGAADCIESKFNPYHDPRNGQFTFAPGGPRSLARVIISDRRRSAGVVERSGSTIPSPPVPSARNGVALADASSAFLSDAVFRPNDADLLQRTQYRPPSRSGIGGNSRAFHDPMTLEQAFPGLHQRPGGAILALADNIFDLAGPGRELTTELSLQYSKRLIEQIKAVDPSYRHDSFGLPATLNGQMNEIGDLRLDRAEAFYRVRGEARPLQVETLRFLQRRTDRAYEEGLRKLKAGELGIRLSPEEALGNYVDRSVRDDLRSLYRELSISTDRNSQVRVNSREYDTSGTDRTYRRPDARVGDVAFDVTLSRKTSRTAQVRGFFNSDFKPRSVIIIRPSQLGRESTYAIVQPGK